MTLESQAAVVEAGPRERARSINRCAVATLAFVVLGTAAALFAMPPVPTPGNVAKAFVEARYDRNWSAAWELLCRPARDVVGDHTFYSERSDYVFEYLSMPEDVEVSTGHLYRTEWHGKPAVAVPIWITAENPENWETGGDLRLVEEDGQLRVCDQGSTSGS